MTPPGDLLSFLDAYREQPPRAKVERIGRWTYRIVIEHGLIEWAPMLGGVQIGWHKIGRKRARRKAAKELDKYRRELQRQADVELIGRSEDA